jgi:hypothetical protein
MEFNNTKLRELIKEFGWKMGNMEDFYFHPQDKDRRKPILTKRAVIQLKEGREFRYDSMLIQEAAGRVVVSGWVIDDKSGRKVWTTGEGNPGGKSVEGSFPAAMAEKRWKVRGIIALECGEGAGIYSEDEFNDDYIKEARKKAPAAAPPTAPPEVSPLEAKYKEWWNGGMAAISEACGVPRADFERHLWIHCSAREHAGKWYVPRDKYKVESMGELAAQAKDWADYAYGNLKEVREALKHGNPVALMVPDEDRLDTHESFVLVPNGSAASPTENMDGAE